MSEEIATININGVEYTHDQLTDEQKYLVNQVMDLDQQMASAKFRLAQLEVARDNFSTKLDALLNKSAEKEPSAA